MSNLTGKYLAIRYDETIREDVYKCLNHSDSLVTVDLKGKQRQYWSHDVLAAFDTKEDAKLLLNMQRQYEKVRTENRNKEKCMAQAIINIAQNYDMGDL